MRLLPFLLLFAGALSAQEWPLHFAPYSIEVVKGDGLEQEDPSWMHLHHGHHTAAEAEWWP